MYKVYIIKIKNLYYKFLKLPIYYKILTSILMSLFLHLSFSLLFYIGLYNYTYKYNIPFIFVEELNLNLLIIPLYFDTFKLIISMFIIMFLIMIIIKFKFIKIKFKKNQIKFRTLNSYVLFRYRECKKKFCSFNSREFILLRIYLSIGLVILFFALLIAWILSIDGGLKFLILIITPVIFGVLIKIEEYNFRIFLLNIITFLLISFTIGLTSDGVRTYLTKTTLGGEIPISIKIKKDFHDGYLILMTKEKVLLMDVNKSIISEIPRKSIGKINYLIKKESKTISFESKRLGSITIFGRYNNDFNSSNQSKLTEEILGLNSPASLTGSATTDYKFDFNHLHN